MGPHELPQSVSAMNKRLTQAPLSFPGNGERAGRLFVLWWCVAMAAVTAHSAIISEDFSTSPFAHGWKANGDTNLFYWNAANQNLEVTWDSSRTNSFFHLPLGTIVS